MVKTILMAVSKWAVDNLGCKEALKDVGTEVLNKVLWSPLKKKIASFFDEEKEVDIFIQQISESEAINAKKPYRDIEDVYEKIKGVGPKKELFDTIANFFLENPDIVKEANFDIAINDGLKINQTAGRDIVNAKWVETFIIKNS